MRSLTFLTVLILLVLVSMTAAKSKSKRKETARDRQKLRYNDAVSEYRESDTCKPFATEESQYNCIAFKISPFCFHNFLVSKPKNG